jgi:hypothetical protein
MMRSLVGTPLLPVPPPLPPPRGGRVPRTPHDGTTADDTHAIVGTPLLPVPPPLPPPTPSGGRGRVPRTPHDGTAAEARRCAITTRENATFPTLGRATVRGCAGGGGGEQQRQDRWVFFLLFPF